MMSCRLAQLVARTPKSYYGVLPSQYGRAFYAAKKTDAQAKADPKSKEGAGAKPNPGSPKKSEATAQSTVGSTGPGAVGKDNRGGKEETLKGAAAKQQAPNTNYQQKRTFLTGWSVYAQDSRKPAASTSGAKKDDKEGFVSEQSKKNVDPEPSIDKGTVEMLEFYPEKPGSRLEQQLGLGQQKQNNQNPRQSGGSAQDKSGDGYDSKRHNPSRTGREQDDKYLDEALSSKSGPLVGDDKGKRRFSTSAAHSTTTPSGKGSKGSAMGAGHDALINDGAITHKPPIDTPQPKTGGDPLPSKAQGGGCVSPDSASGLKGTERERTGDDRRDGKGQKGFDTDLGPIDGGQRKPAPGQPARRLHTSASLLKLVRAQEEERQTHLQREMLSPRGLGSD